MKVFKAQFDNDLTGQLKKAPDFANTQTLTKGTKIDASVFLTPLSLTAISGT